MAENLPDNTPSDEGRPEANGATNININELSLHANDIDALRRLHEASPELASNVLRQKDNESRRDHSSFRLGMAAAVFVVAFTLSMLAYLLTTGGVIISIVMVFLLISIAFLIKVMLTGEWPETTWLGHLVAALVKVSGGKPKAPHDE